MTITKQAILGMIEVDKDNDELVIITTSGTFTLIPTRNTYANIIDLAKDLNTQLIGFGNLWLNDDFKITITFISRDIVSISGTLNDILGGFYTAIGSSATYVYIPLYSWIPRYRSNDGKWFAEESDSIIKGSIGVSGNLSGIAYTPRQKKSFEWPFVKRENVFATGAENDSNRSFETVINDSRAKVLQYADSGNIYCKGVYYISSIADYTGHYSKLTHDWVDGIANDETYVFCTADAPSVGGQSNPTVNKYYDVTLMLTTATAPTWE